MLLGTSVLTTVLQHRHLPTLAPLLALELLLLISFDALCVAAGSPFHLDAPRAVLAGMSQGGFLSLRAAMLAPQRVRAQPVQSRWWK